MSTTILQRCLAAAAAAFISASAVRAEPAPAAPSNAQSRAGAPEPAQVREPDAERGTGYTIADLSIRGEIEGENAVFTMAFTAEVSEAPCRVPLAGGAVAFRDGAWTRHGSLSNEEGRYVLTLSRRGRHAVRFDFAAQPVKEGDWRRTRFTLPAAAVRDVVVQCDRADLEVDFPGALGSERRTGPDGPSVAAFLGLGGTFDMRWKPEIKKLAAERVVECEANLIASAGVGALHVDALLAYRVVQGSLSRLAAALSSNLTVTQVRGEDIQDWSLDRTDPAKPLLIVTLNRPKDAEYRLQIDGELVLPRFPCVFDLPSIVPADVIRASGHLNVGTGSAIRLLVTRSLGLTQIDQAAFPKVALGPPHAAERPLPTRCPFTYQFTAMPFTLTLEADDVVTALGADDRLVLSVADNTAVFQAAVELDIRDAPAREAIFETDPAWSMAGVTGAELADYDVRDEAGRRVVRAYFRNAVQGRILADLRLERALDAGAASLALPSFAVRGAKSERGHLALAGEKGLRLTVKKTDGLIEVHTGSTPMRVPDAQHAFRFKEAGWSAEIGLERTRPAVHSEVFHLATLGDGVLYGSALVTYHISAAPVREFALVIPAEFQNVEFTGRDVRRWEHSNTVWTVTLQEKILGDYNLLVTYDRPMNYAGGDLAAGGVHTTNTESEVGYLAVASSASLKADEQARDPSVIRIDRDELPEAYALLVKDPLLAAYKYVRAPHEARLTIARFETESLLGQVADHVSLQTDISREGESVSTASYFVKNASAQYLAVALPPEARLWSTRLVEDNGRGRDLAVLQDGDKLLIPVPRPRDLNLPSRIELVYAQNPGRPTFCAPRLKLEAPSTPSTPVPFSQWSVRLPSNLAAAGVAGNAVGDQPAGLNGLGAVLSAAVRVWRTLARSAPAWCLLALAVAAAGCLAGWLTGRRRPVLWTLGVGILVLLVLPAVLLPSASARVLGALKAAFDAVLASPRVLSFTRSAGLPEDPPLVLVLSLVPGWMGSTGSFWLLLAAGLAGAVILAAARLRAPAGPLARAVGLTLLLLAAAQTAPGRALLALALIAGAPVAAAWGLVEAARRAGSRRGRARAWSAGADLPPFEPAPAASAPEAGGAGAPEGSGSAGHAVFPLLAGLGAAALALAAAASGARAQAAAPAAPLGAPGLTIRSFEAAIEAPGVADEAAGSAQVRAELEIEAERPTAGPILAADCVLTAFEADSPRRVALEAGAAGYVLNVRRAGTYRVALAFQASIRETNGEWRLDFRLPRSLRTRATLGLPAGGLDVRSDAAVHFTAAEQGGRTQARALFGTDGRVQFAWRPTMRKTELERTASFCEVNSLLVFEPGIVSGRHQVRYQIAQGEIKVLRLVLPEAMSVTAVSAPGLSTWRFDPATRGLEAILQKPASDVLEASLLTQTPREGLPYEAVIGAPQVQDALRQRGALALAASESVQIAVEPGEGLHAMNISDFAPDVLAAAGLSPETPIRRAFRYHQLPVAAKVRGEPVLPEIRIEEKGSLSIADERIVLSTQLKATVAKAGIFSLRLSVPDGFDVESLTGQDVSHWDELQGTPRAVVVHFVRPVTGLRELNLVLARMERGLGASLAVPRVGVEAAAKHTGTLVVSAERGVRLTALRREGVSELNPRDLGIAQPGVLAFALLRPDWALALKTEVLAPAIKPELLQRVAVADGLLKGRVYIRYRIENAGAKVFLLQAPETNALLTVSGPDIAKVQVVDPSGGVWQVTLHNKVESSYALAASYQIPFDTGAGEAEIAPLLPVGTDPPRGYLAILSDGRAQIKPLEEPVGLKPEDARAIPAQFGAGDLSDALLCYRTIQPDYRLRLAVVRRETAASLPASVTETRLASVVSEDGRALTRLALRLNVGDLRFLTITLPDDGDRLWSAFVNGRPAPPAREGSVYRVPLDAVEAGEPASVELVYAGRAAGGWRRRLEGPRLNLPLTDIQWSVTVAPGRLYYGFGGTLECVESGQVAPPAAFDAGQYLAFNRLQGEADVEKAKSVMAQGEAYARQGKQKLARQSLESALNYSRGRADVNEDARVQYHNLFQQQAVAGLVNRRAAVREAQNIPAEAAARQAEPERPAALAQPSLSDKESDSLRIVSEKLLRLQEAASGMAQAIRVTLPEHGRKLEFRRSVQIDPEAAMAVEFRSVSAEGLRRCASLGLVALVLLAVRLAMRRRKEARRA